MTPKPMDSTTMSNRRCYYPFVVLCVAATMIGDACGPSRSGHARAGKIAQIHEGTVAPHYRAGEWDISPGGETLALPLEDRGVQLWDLKSGRASMLPNIHGKEGGVGSVAYSATGRALAASHGLNGITIWAVPEGRESKRILQSRGALHMTFTEGDRVLLAEDLKSIGDDPNPLNSHCLTLRWDTATGNLRSSVDFGPGYLFDAISPCGRYGVADTPELTVGVDDLTTRARLFELPKFGNSSFWHDGSRVVHLIGTRISIIEVPSGKVLKRLDVDTPPPMSPDSHPLSLSSRVNVLAVGRYPTSNLASLISLDSGKVLGSVECGPPLTICERIRLSAEARILVTGTYAVNSHDEPIDPWLKVWRLPEKW